MCKQSACTVTRVCISYSWEMSAYCFFVCLFEASAILQTVPIAASASRAQRVIGMHGKCSLRLGPLVWNHQDDIETFFSLLSRAINDNVTFPCYDK